MSKVETVKTVLLVIGIFVFITVLAITVANLSVIIYNELIEKLSGIEPPYREIVCGIMTTTISFTFMLVSILALCIAMNEPIHKTVEKAETNILEEIDELRREVIEELKEIEKKLEKKFKS